MNKALSIVLKLCLFTFLGTLIIGLYFLAAGQESNALLLAKIGGYASVLYTIIAMREVVLLRTMPIGTRLKWIVLLLLMQILAGIAFFLTMRGNYKLSPRLS
jgi:hypothetical protein